MSWLHTIFSLDGTSVGLLTLILVMANFAYTKWCKKPEKWLEPWQMGTHMSVLRKSELSNEYLHDTV